MPAIVTAPPALEPVSLAEAKAHLRLDGADEDALVERLIAAARRHVEHLTGLALISQGWSAFLDRWPRDGTVRLPVAPVRAVADVLVHPEDGPPAALDPAHYVVDAASRPARVMLRGSRHGPVPGRRVNGIEVVFIAGFGDAPQDVPAELVQAVLLIAAHWFENRAAVADPAEAAELPLAAASLIAAHRRARL